MTLEDKISTILEDIEITEEENGRLILHSDYLEDLRRPFKRVPIVRNILNLLCAPNKGKLKHLIAKSLESYLQGKVDTSGSEKEKNRYSRLLEAFQDFHNIRINDLNINYDDKQRPNFLIRHIGDIAILGSVAASATIPYVREQIPWYVKSSLLLGALFYEFRARHSQSVDFPVPDLDEIKKDIQELIPKYREEKKKRDAKITFTKEKYEEFIKELQEMAISQDTRKMIMGTVEEEGPNKIVTLKGVKRKDSDPSKIPEMKKRADAYLQKYCPTLDLDKIKVILKRMWHESGKASRIRNAAKISKPMLETDMDKFFGIYSHEVGHLDGVRSEGKAQYLEVNVMADMAKDFPDERFGLDFYCTLLEAVVHTHVTERKKSIRNGNTKLAYLKDVVVYNARRIINGLFWRPKPPVVSTGINEKISNELHEIGVPDEIIRSVFENYEDPSLGEQLSYGLQAILKRDEFGVGYTKDLYELMKHKGRLSIEDDGARK
jgi:hypothetical protein